MYTSIVNIEYPRIQETLIWSGDLWKVVLKYALLKQQEIWSSLQDTCRKILFAIDIWYLWFKTRIHLATCQPLIPGAQPGRGVWDFDWWGFEYADEHPILVSLVISLAWNLRRMATIALLSNPTGRDRYVSSSRFSSSYHHQVEKWKTWNNFSICRVNKWLINFQNSMTYWFRMNWNRSIQEIASAFCLVHWNEFWLKCWFTMNWFAPTRMIGIMWSGNPW